MKTIHYITPELAAVDDYSVDDRSAQARWSDWPYRAGYANFIMAKRNGRWVIIISHTADFNATAPAAK